MTPGGLLQLLKRRIFLFIFLKRPFSISKKEAAAQHVVTDVTATSQIQHKEKTEALVHKRHTWNWRTNNGGGGRYNTMSNSSFNAVLLA